MKDCGHLALSKETTFQYVELIDSKVQTKKDIIKKRKKINEFITDETLIKTGFEYIWLWVAIEPENKIFLKDNHSKLLSIVYLGHLLYPLSLYQGI